MSLLSHQSAVNSDKDFWLKAEPGISTASQFVQTAGGSVMDYNADIRFALDPAAVSTGRILGVAGSLYVETPNAPITFSQFGDGTARTQINPDSTWQNGFAGIYTSTLMSLGDKVELLGYNTTGHQLTMNQRDSANNLLQSLDFYLPRGTSTMSVLSYQSKDSMSYNPITSPIIGLNPYNNNSQTPIIQIPTYTLSTGNIQVSTINGVVPLPEQLISVANTMGGSTVTVPNNTPTTVYSTTVPGLDAGKEYLFDIPITLQPFSGGTGTTFGANTYLQMACRLGGSDGEFNYAWVMYFPAGNLTPVSGISFSLVGISQAGTQNTNVDIIAFQDSGSPCSVEVYNGGSLVAPPLNFKQMN